MTPIRKLIFILADIIIIAFSLIAAIWLKFDKLELQHIQYLLFIIPVLIPVGLIAFWSVGLYNRTLRFTSLPDMVAVFTAVTGYSMLKLSSIYFLESFPSLSAVFIIDWMICLLLIGTSRIAPRVCLNLVELSPLRGWLSNKGLTKNKRVMIVGAGQGGESILREIKRNINLPIDVVGLIDDNPQKAGQIIHGVKVVGNTEQLAEMAEKCQADEVIIAIPSASGSELRRIVKLCQSSRVRFKTLPGLQDIIGGKLVSLQLRDIAIEDLLRRSPSEINLAEIAAYVTGKTVMVTGAGGSIGSEICRQILPFQPTKLLLLGHGENSIFTTHQELLRSPNLGNTCLIPIITDIQDRDKINALFNAHRPEIVFHAAAHKHVPLMELNPEEAVKNNVLGTRNLVDASHNAKVERFVMISTDKAVNPTSVMGASKRVAEKILKCYARRSSTRFVAVRFGNVLGSRGSVIPMFKEQIEKGGPITITHPKMIRYFMTIPEASKLVIQAGAYGKGGEVFILDMGEPVRIVDLAEDLIRLAGLEVGRDIEIKFTGIRPGEKLYEELLTASEGITATRNSKIFVARPEDINEEELQAMVEKLEAAARMGKPRNIIKCFQDIVPSFAPNRDMIHNEKPRDSQSRVDEKPKLRVVG
ncbi:MAG TPA: nucleoside-diphosphate sugar epimerase/dehydratase [Candidatus Rifleibacterium sp.]|nr:nucleoside-diphosphate sugar epimerase/dehydratase [Candidatus Rifleibacterium sp.]HPT44449.1 nucleoside-diphosphate sugar epimerase/dehydratase [Candidatus Rifleibacterium sp.]